MTHDAEKIKITLQEKETIIKETIETREGGASNYPSQSEIDEIKLKINSIEARAKNTMFIVDWYIENNVRYVEFSRIKTTETELSRMKTELLSYLKILGIEWNQVHKHTREFIPVINFDSSLSSQLQSLYTLAGYLVDAVVNLKKII